MDKRGIRMIAFLLCLCINLIPCRAFAVSTADAAELISADKKCSLSVSYSYNGTAFAKLPVKLYKIADVSEDFWYSPASSFAGSGLVLNGIQTQGEWNVIRSTLETYIITEGIKADFSAETNSSGSVFFENLKPGLYLAATERLVQDGFAYVFDSALIALPGLDESGLCKYEISVVSKCRAIPQGDFDKETELSVLKLWNGDSGLRKRPKNIEVEIFRDGISYKTVTLSEDNNWTYSWSAKNDGADWKVVERNVPSGYTMTVEERETSFVLTNTLNFENPGTPSIPDTGSTSNILLYAIIMNISGAALIILGIARKRKQI